MVTGKTASMLDGLKTVLPLTHPRKEYVMTNLHNLKFLYNLKPRLLLLSIAAFLVFAVTLQGSSKALVAETPNISNSTAAQSLNGEVDIANCTKITGSAVDDDDPYAVVSVDIYINGVFKATLTANRCLGPGLGVDCRGFSYTIPSALKDGEELLVEVKYSGTNTNLFGSPRTIRCGASLFYPTLSGTVTSVSGQGQTWEQSIHLTSTESGKITHLIYWKVPEESGSHVGRIWSDTGTLLRTVNFTNESASGWQKAALSSPLSITAGVKYRISYNVNYYGGKILSGLTSPYINEPLIAWRGFYTTPSGTFPNTSSVSNFLADVVLNVPE
jgi:hypothetical protein